MSTTAIERNGTERLPSADALIESLTADTKRAVFVHLVRDVINVSGGHSLVPVFGSDGESLGYYVPPALAREQARCLAGDFTSDRLGSIRQAMASPRETFDPMSLLDELDREDRG